MNDEIHALAGDSSQIFPWSRDLPSADHRRIAVHVDPAAERAIRGGHPWLFEASIRRQSRPGSAGDLAVIFDRKERFLAIGLLDPASAIRVRILHSGKPQTVDALWFRERLAAAIKRRAQLAATETTGYRLVHGENDGLPGLVVDRYASTLVVKLYSAAWIPHLTALVGALLGETAVERLYLRLARVVQKEIFHLPALSDGTLLWGDRPREPLLFQENGLQFEVDPVRGQKTGFFLDQRDNRQRVRELSRGLEVLNVFAYSGGFSVYAAAGGAQRVTSVDVSRPALAAAKRNFALNGHDKKVAAATHEAMAIDAFKALRTLQRQARRFDLVILDPPAFAKSRREVPEAILAYGRLTELGLAVLRRGGHLVQASCSSQIDAVTFEQAVRAAAARVGRPLADVEMTGHAIDHPISFPEGAYLKCLYAHV